MAWPQLLTSLRDLLICIPSNTDPRVSKCAVSSCLSIHLGSYPHGWCTFTRHHSECCYSGIFSPILMIPIHYQAYREAGGLHDFLTAAQSLKTVGRAMLSYPQESVHDLRAMLFYRLAARMVCDGTHQQGSQGFHGWASCLFFYLMITALWPYFFLFFSLPKSHTLLAAPSSSLDYFPMSRKCQSSTWWSNVTMATSSQSNPRNAWCSMWGTVDSARVPSTPSTQMEINIRSGQKQCCFSRNPNLYSPPLVCHPNLHFTMFLSPYHFYLGMLFEYG